MIRSKLLSLFLILFISVCPTFAQVEEQTVGEIKLEFSDIQNVSDEAVLSRIQIREGVAYDQNLVDRSIRSLYGTRFFEFVEARTESMPGGEVRIIFTLQSRYRIEQINITGNEEIKSSRLRKEIASRVGQAIDERAIRRDADKIVEYYREKGYTDVTVDYRIDRNEERGRGVVTLMVQEGQRLEIDKIIFEGNTAFSNRDLKKQMETKRHWLMSWLTGGGRFDEVTFQEDLERLRLLYVNEGYLDVGIPESNVSLDYPKPDQIVITIRIDEGRQYRVGNISFEGNELFNQPRLYTMLDLLPGDIFSPETLGKDLERLSDLYGAFGYLDANIRPDRRANLETGDIDLVYQVREGEKFDVESIIIEGNTKTKSTVIIRELALSPGRTFNTIYMKNSEARLKNTRFFEEVQLSPESTNVPGKKNLKIKVKEGRTGNFQFGAGFSSLEDIVLFFEISQSNFDLFKWRSPLLQGDGQKFRFKGSIGSVSNEVVLAFEEPWLFERRLSLGVELFRRETDFNSTTYNELRTGLQLFLRKRLFGLIDGQATYTYEVVDLDGVTGSAPPLIIEESANSPRAVSKLSLAVWRDTRNDLIFTSRGTRISATATFAGLGGDTEYVKFETRNAFFIPMFQLGDQVLSILARAGTVWEYSGDRIPFFDRFYLGGPDSLRGFEFREVGPVDLSTSFVEPVGGNTYAFGSLEYTVKVADSLRLALFYDWGFVNEGDFNFDPSSYNDNWGVGIRLLVLGNPLRLDYGIPITTTTYGESAGQSLTNNRGNQFNFSFGTRF